MKSSRLYTKRLLPRKATPTQSSASRTSAAYHLCLCLCKPAPSPSRPALCLLSTASYCSNSHSSLSLNSKPHCSPVSVCSPPTPRSSLSNALHLTSGSRLLLSLNAAKSTLFSLQTRPYNTSSHTASSATPTSACSKSRSLLAYAPPTPIASTR